MYKCPRHNVKMLTTTLRAALKKSACKERYDLFALYKGSRWGLDTPFPLLEVLENNGLLDALWSLKICQPADERDKIARVFACDCAERVLPLFEAEFPQDNRPRLAIEVSRRFALGTATKQELQHARARAWAAARNATRNATRDAARATARDAAWAVARNAAPDNEYLWQRQHLAEMLQ